MKKLLTSAAVLALGLSFNALAGGNTTTGTISSVYVNNSWTMVHAPDITGNPDNCAGTSHYAIVPSHPNYETMHETLMAAKLSNSKVRFWVQGCSGQNSKYPRIVSIWLY
ncbi:hypothetical protein [Pseudoalteromonas luteoviolacea]|uniref:Secreted protein n=1 Tax=Pseudoalteromonas luteoviolacea S4060-1 TaxID=1365257 RepID=A0A167PDT9_9GAMM|nr:hypothetical protein [Pseudoalteromonas luteoviolacea]KZN39365.1 hypothetical protein N480_00620 [Pseudoalteromonas luteoviolacea S2607]KZN70420.1 hypothetical protein N478_00520 [Pseudoalteromonas luteoviolacea S4060-1]